MNLLCRIGLHLWKPHWRVFHDERLIAQYLIIMPSLFAGPPYLVPAGAHIETKQRAGHKCTRCGKVRR